MSVIQLQYCRGCPVPLGAKMSVLVQHLSPNPLPLPLPRPHTT